MTWRVENAEAYAFLKTLEDNSIDATITDPPYSSGGQFRADREKGSDEKYFTGSGITSKRFEGFSGDSRDQRSFLAWVALWLHEVYRVSKTGAIVMLFTDWRQLPTTTDALQIGGFIWRGIAVWDKLHTRPVPPGRFTATTEFIVWGSKGPMPPKEGADFLPGVFPIPKVGVKDRRHPTEKSITLLRRLVRAVPPGSMILDPFLGSGATAAAAVLEGRNVVGSELSAHYTEVSRKACEWADVKKGRG